MNRLLLVLLVAFPLAPACVSAKPESSVNPGINEPYLSPEVDVERWVGILEGESREIFTQREAIAAMVGLAPGDVIADVGAGTGIFLDPFARAVGDKGAVFAVELVPAFIEHMTTRIQEVGLTQVRPHLCTETSVDLPRRSIDVAFICDVYHHFEYPRSSMASIHRALKHDGEVVLIDFEKIPGETREFIMGHVRADKQQVLVEMDSFGFALVEEVEVDGLVENYFLRFNKR